MPCGGQSCLRRIFALGSARFFFLLLIMRPNSLDPSHEEPPFTFVMPLEHSQAELRSHKALLGISLRHFSLRAAAFFRLRALS
jgi:hypothetical protein